MVSNVAPRLCAELQGKSLNGDFAGALKVQDRLVPLHDAVFLEPGLAGAKCGLALLGLQGRVFFLVPARRGPVLRLGEFLLFHQDADELGQGVDLLVLHADDRQ